MADRKPTNGPLGASPSIVLDQRHRKWNKRWAHPNMTGKWAGRGVLPEIVEAVDTGWLPSQGRVLDIGCGLGDVAAWFAQRGFHATGADYAAAVYQASEQHAAYLDKGLRFLPIDICGAVPKDHPYDIIIDVGCLHGIPDILVDRYVANVSAMASPRAKMLLFMKAFRDGEPFGDEAHTQRKVKWVQNTFSDQFTVERHAAIYLNKDGIPDPSDPLPGLMFRLSRVPPARKRAIDR